MSEIIIEAGRTEKNYWADLWRYRELFLILAWRDLSVRYKQTIIPFVVQFGLYVSPVGFSSMVMGLDQVIESILTRLGDLEKAYIIDDYAEGKDTGIIDLLLVGNSDQHHLNDLSRETERYIKRKIRPLVLTSEEFKAFMPKLENRPNFLVWERQEKN
jgi:hypothetical protein